MGRGSRTWAPAILSGYDMTLNNLTTNDLVAGVSGNCFSFSNTRQTMLSRVHSASDDRSEERRVGKAGRSWSAGYGAKQKDVRVCTSTRTGQSEPSSPS